MSNHYYNDILYRLFNYEGNGVKKSYADKSDCSHGFNIQQLICQGHEACSQL